MSTQTDKIRALFAHYEGRDNSGVDWSFWQAARTQLDELEAQPSAPTVDIEKARKWDELQNAVGKFYDEEHEGDLGDIGELCARKLGYL